MAKAKVISVDSFIKDMAHVAHDFKAIAKPALYEGANVLADELRKKIQDLPERDGHVYIKQGETGRGVTKQQKEALLNGMGIARMRMDNDTYEVKIGFEGYYENLRNGWRGREQIPISMIARAVESGTSFLQKTPFMRPAFNAAEARVKDAMVSKMEELWNKYGNNNKES